MSDPTITLSCPACRPPARGVFLPSLRWTTDRQEVERMSECLLMARARLAALLSVDDGCREQASWWMMADAALSQIDRDIDALVDWMEDTNCSTA